MGTSFSWASSRIFFASRSCPLAVTTGPVVTAKGQDLLAKKIRELAQENDVPIVENPPLARALYKQVDIGREIPGDLYEATAEVLAFVYQINQRRRERMNSY